MTTAFLPSYLTWADLKLVKGDPYTKALGLRDAAGLVNTAGWYGLLQVRKDDGSLAVEASTANGYITVGIQGTSPNQWNVLIDIPSLVTAALTDWGVGEWQLQVGPTAASALTYFGGPASLIPDRAF